MVEVSRWDMQPESRRVKKGNPLRQTNKFARYVIEQIAFGGFADGIIRQGKKSTQRWNRQP